MAANSSRASGHGREFLGEHVEAAFVRVDSHPGKVATLTDRVTLVRERGVEMRAFACHISCTFRA